MASVTVKLTESCPGGGHVVFTATGDASAVVRTDIGALTDTLTDHDREAFVRVLVALAKIGRTNAQAKAVLVAGVTVSV